MALRAATTGLVALLVLGVAPAWLAATEWPQTAKLLASDPNASDDFGNSVAIDGERLVVGAHWDDEAAPGAGAAYVFERDGEGRWRQMQKLIAADADHDWSFGLCVAIHGDIMAATAIGADPIGFDETGAVYVFEQDEAGLWQQAKKLTSPEGQALIWGNSVAIDGDTVGVGAIYDDDVVPHTGAVYLFRRDAGGPGNWGPVAKLLTSDGGHFDEFGNDLALDGDRLVVGAAGDDDQRGSAYVFEQDADGAWTEVAKLMAVERELSDSFGQSVDLAGDTVIVGVFGDSDAGYRSGSAYVFQRDPGGVWLEARKLVASDADVGDTFGHEVAISGDTVLVGADPTLVPGPTGAVYVFSRNAGGPDVWGEVDRLVPPDGREHDNFGTALGASGSLLLVGARYHGGGAAYLYFRKPLPWVGEAEEPKH